MTTVPLTLDDLFVGQEFLSDAHHLDAEQIIAFGQAFDPQPFHTDPEAAKDTFFQGLAASGWHTMSLTMKLLVQSIPLDCGIIGIGGTLTWPKPTRPGDTLRVKSRIVEITPSRSRPDRAVVDVQCQTVDQTDAVLQEFQTKILVVRTAERACSVSS